MRNLFKKIVIAICCVTLTLPATAFAQNTDDFVISNGILLKYNGIYSDVTVPEEVYEIADNAFKDHSEIKSITFEGEVYYIGNNTFSGCTSLTDFSGLENAVKVGENVFNDTPWYNSLNGDLKILNNIVLGCKAGISEAVFPDNIVSVAPKAFYKNVSLKKVLFNKNLSEIGSYSFFGCTSLASLSTAQNLQYIGFKAFDETKWISSHEETLIVINDILVKYNSNEETVILPSNINQIGSGAFYENEYINTVSASDSLYYIGESAFENSSLAEFEFNNANVTYIGNNAFKGCMALTEIELSEKVRFIGEDVFLGCAEITLKVKPDSEAHKYAIRNDIKYKFSTVAGDLNSDGVLSMQDVVILQKYIAKLISAESISFSLADIDGSGEINMQDVTYMQKKIAHLI